MKKYLKRVALPLLAMLGVHEHLSAQQKQDLTAAAWHATPSAVTTGAFKVAGFEMADLVAALTAVFIALQIAHLVWKWRRQARIDAEARALNRALPPTDLGSL